MIYITIRSIKKQFIRLKKERKDSLSVKYVISKIYFISLVKKTRRTNTHYGRNDFKKGFLDKLPVEESDYVNNKWIDITEGTKIKNCLYGYQNIVRSNLNYFRT